MSLNWCDYRFCPFCKTELRVKSKQAGTKHFFSFWREEREDKCRKCGAKKVAMCPSCKGTVYDTWKNKEGVYKHGYCGFTGKKIVKNNKKKGKKDARPIKKKEIHEKGCCESKRTLPKKLRKAEGE